MIFRLCDISVGLRISVSRNPADKCCSSPSWCNIAWKRRCKGNLARILNTLSLYIYSVAPVNLKEKEYYIVHIPLSGN